MPELDEEMNIRVHDTLLCPVSFYLNLDTNYKSVQIEIERNYMSLLQTRIFGSGFLALHEDHGSAHQPYMKLIIEYMGRMETLQNPELPH